MTGCDRLSGKDGGRNGSFEFGDAGEAKAFHDFPEGLRDAGLPEEAISGHLNGNSLVEAAGATKSRELWATPTRVGSGTTPLVNARTMKAKGRSSSPVAAWAAILTSHRREPMERVFFFEAS